MGLLAMLELSEAAQFPGHGPPRGPRRARRRNVRRRSRTAYSKQDRVLFWHSVDPDDPGKDLLSDGIIVNRDKSLYSIRIGDNKRHERDIHVQGVKQSKFLCRKFVCSSNIKMETSYR